MRRGEAIAETSETGAQSNADAASLFTFIRHLTTHQLLTLASTPVKEPPRSDPPSDNPVAVGLVKCGGPGVPSILGRRAGGIIPPLPLPLPTAPAPSVGIPLSALNFARRLKSLSPCGALTLSRTGQKLILGHVNNGNNAN